MTIIEGMRTDDGTTFWREWTCEPPGYHTAFTIVRAEWVIGDEGIARQIVHEWRPL